MKAFTTWKDAHTYACKLADDCKRDVGIEKANEFGETVSRVFLLPDSRNRAGHELRCEIVAPGTPV